MPNKDRLDNLLKNTMENLRSMIDVNTVIGDPIETKDGTYIIPVSKLSFGFASGGGEYPLIDKNFHKDREHNKHIEHHHNEHRHDDDYPFSGASGAGISVKPLAFLIVNNDSFRMIPIEEHENTYDRIVDAVPQVLDMVKDFIKDTNNTNKKDEDGNNT